MRKFIYCYVFDGRLVHSVDSPKFLKGRLSIKTALSSDAYDNFLKFVDQAQKGDYLSLPEDRSFIFCRED